MRTAPTTLAACLALAALAVPEGLRAETFTAEIWVDNWFALSVDGTRVAEDSVPITTERSFNAERVTFEAERPFVLGLVAMDFKEDDTGLEYIGTRRQQMGDGGAILQVTDASGALAAVSDADWRCLVVHTAPLDTACARARDPVPGVGACAFAAADAPAGWDAPGFDAAAWPAATVHGARAVDPKDGYDRIDWDPSARFIWGPDLERDNTVLCRLEID